MPMPEKRKAREAISGFSLVDDQSIPRWFDDTQESADLLRGFSGEFVGVRSVYRCHIWRRVA